MFQMRTFSPPVAVQSGEKQVHTRIAENSSGKADYDSPVIYLIEDLARREHGKKPFPVYLFCKTAAGYKEVHDRNPAGHGKGGITPCGITVPKTDVIDRIISRTMVNRSEAKKSINALPHERSGYDMPISSRIE